MNAEEVAERSTALRLLDRVVNRGRMPLLRRPSRSELADADHLRRTSCRRSFGGWFAEFDPEEIILFGSRAWGDPRPDSDYRFAGDCYVEPGEADAQGRTWSSMLEEIGIRSRSAREELARGIRSFQRGRRIPRGGDHATRKDLVWTRPSEIWFAIGFSKPSRDLDRGENRCETVPISSVWEACLRLPASGGESDSKDSWLIGMSRSRGLTVFCECIQTASQIEPDVLDRTGRTRRSTARLPSFDGVTVHASASFGQLRRSRARSTEAMDDAARS